MAHRLAGKAGKQTQKQAVQVTANHSQTDLMKLPNDDAIVPVSTACHRLPQALGTDTAIPTSCAPASGFAAAVAAQSLSTGIAVSYSVSRSCLLLALCMRRGLVVDQPGHAPVP